MKRVVADTNVLISALMFGGLPGTFLDLAYLGSFCLVTSPPLLDELQEKLVMKFQVSSAETKSILAKLGERCEVVETAVKLAVIRDDPDDDRVLECAVDGWADSIVSGDRHLLQLGSYAGISILKVRAFLDELRASGA